jgi:hypothetical protein
MAAAQETAFAVLLTADSVHNLLTKDKEYQAVLTLYGLFLLGNRTFGNGCLYFMDAF